jgi:hypothetical protein
MTQGILKDEKAFYAKTKCMYDHHEGKEAMRHADVINSRIGALLAHVSVMIAVAIVTFSQIYIKETKLDVFDDLIIADIIGYVCTTLACLLGLAVVSNYDFRNCKSDQDIVDTYILAVSKRRQWYRCAYHATWILTVIFMISIMVKVIRYMV